MLLFSTKIGNYRKNDILGGGPKIDIFWGVPKTSKNPKSDIIEKSTFCQKREKSKIVNYRKSTFPKIAKVEKVEKHQNRHFPKTQKVEKGKTRKSTFCQNAKMSKS